MIGRAEVARSGGFSSQHRPSCTVIVNQMIGFKYLYPMRIVVGHMHQPIRFGKNSLNSNFSFLNIFSMTLQCSTIGKRIDGFKPETANSAVCATNEPFHTHKQSIIYFSNIHNKLLKVAL